MRWDYLLFDLDGTLHDSKPGIAKTLVATLERLGRSSPPWQSLGHHIGPPLRTVLSTLMPEASKPEVEQATVLYREIYNAGGIFDAELFPGIADLLRDLKAAGKPVFVATSKPWPQAKRIIENYAIADLFQGVYGPELDGTLSEKPELIRHLLREEGLQGRGIMIGDRQHDVIGAKANRLYSLGVLYGYGTREELLAAGADRLCESTQALRDFLFEAPQS